MGPSGPIPNGTPGCFHPLPFRSGRFGPILGAGCFCSHYFI